MGLAGEWGRGRRQGAEALQYCKYYYVIM